MSHPADKRPPTVPPPGVPLDQTMAPIYYEGSDVGLGIVWAWRRFRGLLTGRNHKP